MWIVLTSYSTKFLQQLRALRIYKFAQIISRMLKHIVQSSHRSDKLTIITHRILGLLARRLRKRVFSLHIYCDNYRANQEPYIEIIY